MGLAAAAQEGGRQATIGIVALKGVDSGPVVRDHGASGVVIHELDERPEHGSGGRMKRIDLEHVDAVLRGGVNVAFREKAPKIAGHRIDRRRAAGAEQEDPAQASHVQEDAEPGPASWSWLQIPSTARGRSTAGGSGTSAGAPS